MLLDCMKIPQVFTFYTAYMLRWSETGALMPTHHYCTKCGQMFAAVLKIKSNMGYDYVDDKAIYCPHCGEQYVTNGYKGRNYDIVKMSAGDIVPLDMTIKLEKFRYGLKLTAAGTQLKPVADMNLWDKRRYTETITFDINKRKTIFKTDNIEIELANPYDETFLKTSHLTYLYGHPCLTEYKKRMLAMTQLLRKEICKGLKERLGHKIKSMYRPYGSTFGPIAIPVMNIAYRMVCIDAPNLSEKVLTSNPDKDAGEAYHMNEKFLTAERLDGIRKEKDTVTAFIKIAGLPDKRVLRKILAKEPFDCKLLSDIYKIVKPNIDNVIAVYKCCTADKHERSSSASISGIIKAANTIRQYYGPADAARLLKNSDSNEIHDTAYMLRTMSDEIKDKFNKTKPSVLAVHDWLVIEKQKEKNKLITFDTDNKHCRRLEMQLDNIKFFVPKTSADLYIAGVKLKNCVSTYADRVVTKETQIVLAANENDKLIICIEVSGNKIKQAKLAANKLVATDDKLNAAVIDWAEKLGINWEYCRDIKPKEKTITAVAV